MQKIRKIISESGMSESFAFGITVRGWIAIALVGTVCYCATSGIEIKEPLYTLSTMALGFYFGGRNQTGSFPTTQDQRPPQ